VIGRGFRLTCTLRSKVNSLFLNSTKSPRGSPLGLGSSRLAFNQTRLCSCVAIYYYQLSHSRTNTHTHTQPPSHAPTTPSNLNTTWLLFLYSVFFFLCLVFFGFVVFYCDFFGCLCDIYMLCYDWLKPLEVLVCVCVLVCALTHT